MRGCMRMMTKTNFLSSNEICKEILNIKQVGKMQNKQYVRYYNTALAFDIETSSVQISRHKLGVMYAWTVCAQGVSILGRTWEEFLNFTDVLSEKLQLSPLNRLCIYVHNLSFEFQFIRKRFEWESVFCNNERRPLYALTKNGIEFRCSYMLSRMSLYELSKTLKSGTLKLIGDLDYEKVRHSETILTKDELGYIENDGIIVYEYIQQKVQEDGGIHRIPLTQTGYVRNLCKKACLYSNMSHKKNTDIYAKWRSFMKGLTLEVDEYKLLKKAFQGGFTHASAWKSRQVLENVGTVDEASAYPAMMVSKKFPMSKGEKISIKTKEEFEHNLKMYCCLFEIKFINIRASQLYEDVISSSRCYGLVEPVIDNGRIVSAKELITVITEQDYLTYQHFYVWDSKQIRYFYRYKKQYLPKQLIETVLKLYENKTILKDIDERYVEYFKSKEMINSSYGMMVTDIVRDNITYINGEWGCDSPDIETAINKYNSDTKRFLFYPWGVWVTAYARRTLLEAVYNIKEDYCYSDTDSVKFLNPNKHMKVFENMNKRNEQAMIKALEYHQLPLYLYKPKTVNGNEKVLGIWEVEQQYDKFKTLGAKRYLTEQDNKLHVTVSGIKKKSMEEWLQAAKYLPEIKGNTPFEAFEDELKVPSSKTGKLTLYYQDERIAGYVTDYRSTTLYCDELSSIHAENAEFSISLSDAYIAFLKGINTVEE